MIESTIIPPTCNVSTYYCYKSKICYLTKRMSNVNTLHSKYVVLYTTYVKDKHLCSFN